MKPGQIKQANSPPLLTIYTLGRFEVYRGAELIEDSNWKRRKAKSLFKLLLLAPNQQLLKDRLLEWLWPDSDPARAANNLHRTLFVLRRVLQPDLSDAANSHYIAFKDELLSLEKNSIAWVDINEFERLIQLGHQQGDNLKHYESARMLYQGDFLPEDLYEDWAQERRETLKAAYCNLLQRIARLYTQRSAYNDAIGCLQDLIGIDYTNEEAYRDLMRLHAQTGQRHHALHLYQQLCKMLQQELGVEPASDTTALYHAILEERWQPLPEPIILPRLQISLRPPEAQQRHPLVGRDKELEQLIKHLQQLEDKSGAVVIVSGEQGVGKTRLAQELVLHAQATGMQIMYGAAHEQEGHLPYGPFVEAIRGALDEQSIAFVREKLGVLVKDLARLLPELAAINPLTASQSELGLDQERQRLFDAVAATFLAFAEISPVVVFLDDLHAAGESSMQLLHYLARRISNEPILILCTVREEEVQRGKPITRLCRELISNQLAQPLTLSRLNQADTAQLCTELFGQGQLSPELRATLCRLTEGNPFFIHELALALKESDALKNQDGAWYLSVKNNGLLVPTSVREVIELRLGTLSHEAYRLAGVASVIGQEFSYELLTATAQWNETTLLDLLDEMLRACIIEEIETGYRFRHGLIRQVTYDELSTHRRAWLHGQVAQALEHLSGHRLDQQAAILVHHYERAGRYEVAFRYLIRAGDWARAAYASREALDFYNRALILYRQYPDLMSIETQANLLDRRAQTFIALSEFDAAIGDLEKLLKSSREAGDQRREGEILYQLCIAHYWAHRLPKASAYLDRAIKLAIEQNYHELHDKSLKLRDILNSTQGKVRQVDQSDTAASTGHDVYSLPAEEHWGLAMLAHLRSDFETAIYHAQACIELGQTYTNTFLTLGGYFVLGMSQSSSGNYQLALDNLLYALQLSETAEDRFWRARLLNTAGWVYRELFDLGQAIQFDLASLELARAGEPRLTEAEGNALANLATDYMLLRDYERVREYLKIGLEFEVNEPFMRWRYLTRMIIIKGRLALAEGNISGALLAADEALAIARDTQARKNIARSCKLRGEALLAAGEIDKARAALCHALSIGVKLNSPALMWPYQLSLAQLEETVGNQSAAQNYYFEAVAIIHKIANHLTDPKLYGPFLAAQPVQMVINNAACSIQFTTERG